MTTKSILVPDIGDFDSVEIIEILVEVGDEVGVDDSLITLESDKAAMEIPTPFAGKITQLKVKVGEKVTEGDLILELEIQDEAEVKSSEETPQPETQDEVEVKSSEETPQVAVESPAKKENIAEEEVMQFSAEDSHASPSIRKLARELGIDLSRISSTGKKGRITDEDLKKFVKNIVFNGGGNGIPAIPSIDFSKFGKVEEIDLSRINKISGKHLHACWLNVPHVTQFDEANIDEIESFRKIQKSKDIKLSPLVFIIKAVVHNLKQYPRFNASLTNDKLVLKKYFHIGVAVDTPNGLMVPVVRDADTKSLTELGTELGELAKKARDGKLSINDMSGACFTISSLGGIGGTQFTPIVNSPEVAILGVSRAQVKPIWNGEEFEPQTMLPLALSYDHRVIDGASGARFITDLSKTLTDIREVLL